MIRSLVLSASVFFNIQFNLFFMFDVLIKILRVYQASNPINMHKDREGGGGSNNSSERGSGGDSCGGGAK